MEYKYFIVPFKREIWEYQKTFFGLFIAIGGLLAFLAIFFLIQSSNIEMELSQFNSQNENGSFYITPEDNEKRNLDILSALDLSMQNLVPVLLFAFAMLSGIISAIYLLGSLTEDRKDRSILFWKSLPVSETQSVLTKFITGLYVVPIISIIVGVAVALLLCIIFSIGLPFISDYGFLDVWTNQQFFGGIWEVLIFTFLSGMWAAPIYAWLMFSSAIAKSSPSLWAFLPPFFIISLEKLFFGQSMLLQFFVNYLSIFTEASNKPEGTSLIVYQFKLFIFTPEMIVGVILSAALLYIAIWLRNNRFEI